MNVYLLLLIMKKDGCIDIRIYIYHLKNLIKIFGFSLERLEKKQKYV